MTTTFRMTDARRTIINIFEETKLPLTASEVNNHVQVNKTTVYRELEFLVNQRILITVNFGDGKVRYEKNTQHHHHLVCDNCGKIEDVQMDESKLLQSIKAIDFEINRHSLEFFGLCRSCK